MKNGMRAAMGVTALSLMAMDSAPTPAQLTPADTRAEPVVETASLHLEFQGLRNPRGTIRVCLWSAGEGFPDCKSGDHVLKMQVPVHGDRAVLDLSDLTPGDYAVSAIHDENDNRKLDKSFIGLPTEGVAFSNNASAAFGPPKFGKVRFTVAGKTEQVMKLKYYL